MIFVFLAPNSGLIHPMYEFSYDNCKRSLISEVSVNSQKPGLKRSVMRLKILQGWVTPVIQLGQHTMIEFKPSGF